VASGDQHLPFSREFRLNAIDGEELPFQLQISGMADIVVEGQLG
jgi:hypothetical protein